MSLLCVILRLSASRFRSTWNSPYARRCICFFARQGWSLPQSLSVEDSSHGLGLWCLWLSYSRRYVFLWIFFLQAKRLIPLWFRIQFLTGRIEVGCPLFHIGWCREIVEVFIRLRACHAFNGGEVAYLFDSSYISIVYQSWTMIKLWGPRGGCPWPNKATELARFKCGWSPLFMRVSKIGGY